MSYTFSVLYTFLGLGRDGVSHRTTEESGRVLFVTQPLLENDLVSDSIRVWRKISHNCRNLQIPDLYLKKKKKKFRIVFIPL